MVRTGKTVHLNAEYDDPSMIRNALSFRFFEWIGVPSPKTSHCLLRLNGRNMGVYLEIEAVNKRFFKRRNISVQALMYAVNDKANFGRLDPDTHSVKKSMFAGYELIIGGDLERRRLNTFITRINSLPANKLEPYLYSRLDVNNYLHWLAGAVFTGNYDGFDQNYAIYRHKVKGMYRMIPWDYEGTWGRNCYGNTCGSDLVRVRGYNQLSRKLLSIPKANSRYQDILAIHLDSTFTLRKLEPVIEEMVERIAPYVYKDKERKWSYSLFRNEPRFIRTYIQERRNIISDAIGLKV
jgi:spore coat protein H